MYVMELTIAATFWLLALALALRAAREPAAGWAAGAFAALATILTIIVVNPYEGAAYESIAVAIQLAAVAVVPLLFYRFAATLTLLPKKWNALAYATTAALCATAVLVSFLGSPDDFSTPLRIYLVALLGQWTWLSRLTLTALWRTANTVPRIARIRVRLIAGAVGLLNVALAAVVGLDALGTVGLTLAAASAIGFFLAFSPPQWVRAIWCRPTRRRLDVVTQELITAFDGPAIADHLLPLVVKLLGAESASLIGSDDAVIATVTPDALNEPSELSRAIDISSSLRVWVPAVTPLFAQDELELLRPVGTMADLAVERAQLLGEERDRAAALEAIAAKLQATNAALELEVIERHEAELEAHRSRAEAEQANNAKSEFLSRMSHELRTPLNSILGFGQLLESDELTADQHDSVEHILKGGHHLLALINEVLDISRIDTGAMSISPEPVEISDVIQEVGDMMRPAAAERRIDVKLDLTASTAIHVRADRQRFKQILINLVSNAIKYNRVEGEVRVGTEVRDGHAIISVSDTGPGITESKLDRLFVPFDRLDAGPSGVEGTGLGLALSKGLAELMGGTLSASSIVGEGSTFIIVLPLEDVPAAELGVAGVLGRDVGGSEHLTVLYIEDNLTNVKLIERILATYPGLRLMTAMQAGTGLELARHHSPELVLLDLHLPDVPGETVLKQLRAEPATKGSKVIILSADATPGQIDRLLEAGADDYLTKPLDVARFREVIEETIGARA